jgi:hypothetical protein
MPFKPFGIFNGVFIPECMVRSTLISSGAKLAYGRLARYAGRHGQCYPAVLTLAQQIGVSLRQAQRYLSELERKKLIRRMSRYVDRGQTSNAYEFIWHELFAEGVTDLSPKESQNEESQNEEVTTDLDYPSTNRKKRDSRPDAGFVASGCTQYRSLREALGNYMQTGGEEQSYPNDRQVVEVVDAAGGASEQEVIECLRFLREARGLRAETKNGPWSYAWFATVVGDYFRKLKRQEIAPGPVGVPRSEWNGRFGQAESTMLEVEANNVGPGG